MMKLSFAQFVAGNWAVVLTYVLASVALTAGVLFDKVRFERAGYRIAGAGFLAHSLLIAVRWQEVGHGPYLAPSEVLSSDAWMIMACLFVFLRLYPRLRPASILALPCAFLLLALSLFYDPGIRTLPTTFRSIWLVVHIALYKIALATLVVGCALAIFYLLKKRSAAGWRQRLPALEVLDIYSYRFAGFGFIFWTIGMLAGSIWAYQSWGRFWGWDPTETWSLITCLMLAGFLHLRRFFRLKGTPAAWCFIGCFGVSILTLFFMATLSGSIHSQYFK
jgi:ABC-type transport system involved in cytochrome c biogenesis permease subunit